MAKSRKSSKAPVADKKGVDRPDDADKIDSETQTPLAGSEDIVAETSAGGPENLFADAADDLVGDVDDAELAEMVLEEDLIDLQKLDGDGLDAVAEAEAETEQELYGEPETDAAALEDLEADERLEANEGDQRGDAEKPSETASQPAKTVPETHAPTPEAQSGGSIWPAVIGGVIAAFIGFLAGRGDVIDNYLPAAFQRPGSDTVAMDALSASVQELQAQATDLASQAEAQAGALAARIDGLEAVSATDILGSVAGLEADLEAIQAELTGITQRTDVLEQRAGVLEERPIPVPVEPQVDAASTESVAALESALAEQRAQIAALAERAEAAEAQAAGEAAELLARAALVRVMTAVESGEAFAPALAELEEVAPVEVPDALREAAQAGVPTLAELQDSFPEAARAGLAAARAAVPESEVAGLSGFLKRQLNVRSVTPREGADPDAVLSRAQAAVRAGDLATTFDELAALPDPARAAMNDWLDAASARKAAQDAANTLADSLNSN